MKKAVVINFTLPPYSGIGGRRWAKFCKYLHREGVDLHIIAAHRASVGYSPWLKDTIEYTKKIHFINPTYPKILGTIPKGILQKIKYKLVFEYAKWKYSKYNYFDPSSDFGNKIIPVLEKKIADGFNNIIVSCGPFHMAYEIGKMKAKYPNVNFIIDFRDPWANNGTTFGFLSISEKQLKAEIELEKTTIKNFDYVISVSKEMSEYFADLIVENSNKFRTIPNGFDKEDFGIQEAVYSTSPNILRFVFTGTVYEKTLHIYREFIENLKLLKQRDPDIYQKMQFDFYGKVPVWFENETAACQDIIKFYGEVSLDEVYTHIANANVCLLFLTDDLTYSRSTKFYEYLVAGKPIAVFSKGGETAEYVANNGAGYACNSGAMTQELERIYEDWKMDKLRVNKSLDISKLDTQKLSESIAQLLI